MAIGITSWIKGLAEGVATPVVDYFKTKAQLRSEERRQKMEYAEAVHQRKVELVKAGLTADMNWEMEFARQAENSWKDEYTLIVVSIPAIMAFLKIEMFGYVFDGAAIVAEGFQALAQTPTWYQLMLVTLFFATVGIRYWRRSQSDT